MIVMDVMIKGPTGGQFANDDAPTRPLMLQGDRGPVKFHNIRIRATLNGEQLLNRQTARRYHIGQVSGLLSQSVRKWFFRTFRE